MKIFRPRTLPQAFSPTIIANLVFGIGVIRYPSGKPRYIISAIWSTIHVLIHVGFVEMADFSKVVRIAGSTTVADNYRNYAIFCTISIAFSIIIPQVKSKVFSCTFKNINGINDRLKRLGIPNDYDVTFKSQIIQFIAAFGFIVIVMILDSKYIVYEHPNKYSRTFYLRSLDHWLIMTFLTDTGCTNIFRYFSNRFQRLNSFLAEPNLHKIVETSLTKKSGIPLTVLKEIHRDLPLNRIAAKQRLLHIIRESRIIHRDLCSMAREINTIFGIQLLFSFSLSLAMTTGLLFNSYVLAMKKLPISPLDAALTKMLPLLWAAFYAMKIFLIIHTGEILKRKAQCTRQLIHTLLNSTVIYNEDVRNELKIFSLQLIQNPLYLTACGFYTIDYRQASYMLGSTATSLIVMIQMQSITER